MILIPEALAPQLAKPAIQIRHACRDKEEVDEKHTDDLTDLCAGPHLMNVSVIKAFKLTSCTGAYWRGSEKNKMLTRVYGTAFTKSADLENISLTFVADETFGYIGRDRNVENLDVMQAVSDMQKDSVLHQYHTFVSMEEPIFSSVDGMVFLK